MISLIEEEKVAVNTRGIPASLRSRFKAFCAQNELTMTDAIVALMEHVVDGEPCVELGLPRRRDIFYLTHDVPTG